MGYAFTSSKNVAAQVRDIGLELVDNALEEIRGNSDFDGVVHTLRKTCKKQRALLRLIRPAFADYSVENDAFRGIADSFSVARDAAVMVRTLEALLAWADLNDAELIKVLSELRDRLAARAQHLRRQMGEDVLLRAAEENFEAGRKRIEDWSFDAKGTDLVLVGLEAGYRRFQKRLKMALKDPSGSVVHDWRKAAKTHWYHVRLFQRCAPVVLDHREAVLNRIGEALGDHHNLQVLQEWVQSNPVGGEAPNDVLAGLIEKRQSELFDEAWSPARQLAAENAGALARRFGKYWTLLD